MTEPTTAAERDIAHVLHPFTNLVQHKEKGPLVIDRGEGIYVFGEDGRQYIEGVAGLWCTALGFNEEELVQAATNQMRKLPYYHFFHSKASMPGIDLAEKLKGIAPVPISKVFFVNSGSEANDTVVKLVWYYNNARGRPAKKKIISRVNAYHGITLASTSLTGIAKVHAEFDLPLPQMMHTDFPYHYRNANEGESEEAYASRLADKLEQMILREGPETVAAFIAEPVMGAGGAVIPPATYYEKIQAVLRKYDVLFIADEVICGFGRTGNMWGSQTFDIKPDIITCAKALSSAYQPIAAVLISDELYQGVEEGSRKVGVFAHGFTYSGHPVAAAVALRTLELYEERHIIDHVHAVSPRFLKRLTGLGGHPLVGNTRGVGLIGGIELVANKKTKQAFEAAQMVGPYISERCVDHGLILRNIENNMAFCPPLIITEPQIDDMFDRFEKALDDTHKWVKRG